MNACAASAGDGRGRSARRLPCGAASARSAPRASRRAACRRAARRSRRGARRPRCPAGSARRTGCRCLERSPAACRTGACAGGGPRSSACSPRSSTACSTLCRVPGDDDLGLAHHPRHRGGGNAGAFRDGVDGGHHSAPFFPVSSAPGGDPACWMYGDSRQPHPSPPEPVGCSTQVHSGRTAAHIVNRIGGAWRQLVSSQRPYTIRSGATAPFRSANGTLRVRCLGCSNRAELTEV